MSTERPRSIAQTLAPLPRWQVISRVCSAACRAAHVNASRRNGAKCRGTRSDAPRAACRARGQPVEERHRRHRLVVRGIEHERVRHVGQDAFGGLVAAQVRRVVQRRQRHAVLHGADRFGVASADAVKCSPPCTMRCPTASTSAGPLITPSSGWASMRRMSASASRCSRISLLSVTLSRPAAWNVCTALAVPMRSTEPRPSAWSSLRSIAASEVSISCTSPTTNRS